MAERKPQKQCLSKKNFNYGSSSKSSQTTDYALTRNMIFSRRRRKRKVGVTLVSMLKKKPKSVDSHFNEALNDVLMKQKVNTVVHNEHEYSDDLKSLSPSTSKSVNCCTPDTAHSYAPITSSCFSPIVIDDSSDTDHSSVADTTNVFSTSAVSEPGNSEDVDYFAQDNCRITHELG